MEKYVALLGIIFIVLVTGLIESDDVFTYKKTIVVSGTSSEEQVDAKPQEDALEDIIPTFEMVLVDTDDVNGKTVETYREYEIYRDDNNEVIKRIPTDHYEYLEYN